LNIPAAGRMATASVAALALLGLTASWGHVTEPRRHTHPKAIHSTSASTAEPSGIGASASGSTRLRNVELVSAHAEIGTTYYIATDNSTAPVFRWKAGAARPERLPLTVPGDEAVANVNVSPNGRYLSYVDYAAQGSPLHVVDLATGRTMRTRQNTDGVCVEPAWAPDSTRLLIGVTSAGQDNANVGILDIRTGAFTRLANRIAGCHLTWAADGKAIAFADGDGKVFVTKPDGSRPRAIPGVGVGHPARPPYSFDLESASVGGARVALLLNDGSSPAGDVVRDLYSNAILDTRTGKKAEVPVEGQLLQVVFRADGNMVIRLKGVGHNKVVLVSASGAIITRADEPSALRDAILLTM
jgi:TolB protein